jgi:hypothetical protein
LNRAALRRGQGFAVVCWMAGTHDGQFYEKKIIVTKSVSQSGTKSICVLSSLKACANVLQKAT